MLMRRCFTRSDRKGRLQGGSGCKLQAGTWGLRPLPNAYMQKTLQQVHAVLHLSKSLCTFGLEDPVKFIYPSVNLVYRSAFPLVRVELYPN